MRLKPLTALSRQEQVVRRISRLIEDGSLAPGERLPSERELSGQLQVSRGTVREAVQFMQALGLVEIKHGSGMFVRAPASGPGGARDEWRSWTQDHADEVRYLLEVRHGLECFAAELASERADATALEGMDQALAHMRGAVESREVPALVESDVEFHRALCAAAGNPALLELATSLGDQLIQERGATWDLPDRPQRSLAEHEEILAAIRSGDAVRARDSVVAHLNSVARDIETLVADGR